MDTGYLRPAARHGDDGVAHVFFWVVVLRAIWPEGAAEPSAPIVVRCMLKASAEAVRGFLYECQPPLKTLAPRGSPMHGPCVLGDVPARLECLRTHFDACACGSWMECESFEPTAYVECLPDLVHDSPTCTTCSCSISCGAGKPSCPAGMECTKGSAAAETCRRPTLQ